MRKSIITVIALTLLIAAAGPAQAFCVTTKVNLANNDHQRNMIMVLTMESDPDFHKAIGVPPGHVNGIDVCDTAWFLKQMSYVYTVNLHWEGESEPFCTTIFTTTTIYSLYPEIVSCKITSGDCVSRAATHSNQGCVTFFPHDL